MQFAESFTSLGFIGPLPLLTLEECREIIEHEQDEARPKPMGWWKGRAASDSFYAKLAAEERIMKFLRPVLGSDIVLWGVDVVRRHPDSVHPWHCDIESSSPEGGFASVWIGVENTSRDSALNLIAGTHKLGRTIQEEASHRGLKRGEASSADVLAWARSQDPDVQMIAPDMQDGDAVIFDGRLWHGTHNTSTSGTRTALLLQYAAADRPVRMIEPNHFEWPFRFLSHPLPPLLVVSGNGNSAVNRLAAFPGRGGGNLIGRTVKRVKLPLTEGKSGWAPYPLFSGATPGLAFMGCHVSVLSPGSCPHPPHAHVEEELLIVIDGEANIEIASSPDDPSPRVKTLVPGQFSYYPAWQHHTIRNLSARPVTYMMFKWSAGVPGMMGGLRARTFDYHIHLATEDTRAFAPVMVLDNPTGWLKRLHCHVTRLKPGAGYAPHADNYDVAIVMLAGKAETIGHVLEPCDVVFYGAGELHGMRNTSSETAAYLVFEFEPLRYHSAGSFAASAGLAG